MSPNDESLYPDVSLVCTHCESELPVAADQNAEDLVWLHERRCAPAPELAVVCADCGEELELLAGLNPSEAIWMHEHDCPAFQLAEAV